MSYYRFLPPEYTPPTATKRPFSAGYPDIFRYRSSVLPVIIPVVLLSTVVAAIECVIVIIWYREVGNPFRNANQIVPSLSVVLGLLLVFRTNSAYDRFWEGRKIWSTVESNIRSLASSFWIGVDEDPNDRTLMQGKRQAMELLMAYPTALMHHLRDESTRGQADIARLLPPSYQKSGELDYPVPLEIIYRLTHHVKRAFDMKIIEYVEWNHMTHSITALTECLANADRIRSTPIPPAYRIHMKQAVFLYCTVLPLALLDAMWWYAIPMTAIVAFLLYGIDGIGSEVENPFGEDANDIRAEGICMQIRYEVDWMMQWLPMRESAEDALGAGTAAAPATADGIRLSMQ